ncbi:efflux transporter outer membrane subunit [Hydrogenophilus thermoluteolus]|nr:efflux transporter outer membrane subunit [Hydrogenophilus thermoluteolus]
MNPTLLPIATTQNPLPSSRQQHVRWAYLAPLFLSACAVQPPQYPNPEADWPKRFHHGVAEVAPANVSSPWLTAAPSLAQLFTAVRAANPEREAALARWAKAAALAEAAQAQAGAVTITANAGVTRSGTGAARTGQASVDATTQAGIDGQWTPDLFGRRAAAARAAALQAEAAHWAAAHLERQLLWQAAQAYLDAIAARAQQAVSERQMAIVAQSRALLDARIAAGLASERERAQLETLAAQLAAQRAQAQAQYAVAVERLVTLTGGGEGPWRDPPPLSADDLLPPPPDPGTPIDLLRRRPDVREVERQLAAAVASALEARAAQYPTFPLTGTLAFAAANPAAMWQMSAASWALAWNLSATLFDGGQLAAEARAADAAVREAAANYRAALVAALGEVEQTLAQLHANDARRHALAAAAQAAERAWQLLDAQYRAGLVDYALVLDAQRTWLSAEAAYQTALATSRNDRLLLEYHLGVPW